MAKINQPIPPQTFEVITVDILNILGTEFAAQSDVLLNAVKFYFERISPIDKVNIPAVVVRYAGSRNRVSGRLEQSLTNVYYIDCYANSKVTDSADSDITSATDVQRIMGAVRWILMFSGYWKLDFAKSIIETTTITSIEMGDQRDSRDTETTMWGRVVFEVNAVEDSEGVPLGVLNDYKTLVGLFEADSVYEWITEKTPVLEAYTENFESADLTDDRTLTSNGVNFLFEDRWYLTGDFPGYGYDGSPRYVDFGTSLETPLQGTIKTVDASKFSINSMWVYASNAGFGVIPGTVRAKFFRNGVQTHSHDFSVPGLVAETNNGFNKIDFDAVGLGNVLIDKFTLEPLGDIVYMAMDQMTWSKEVEE